MKKIIVILLAVLLGLTACGTNDTGSNKLDSIKEKGVITVALEGDWAPWSYHDENDNLVGFDADAARAIAEKLGVEIEIVEAPWESLFAGLESGRYDLVVNGVEYTEERAQKYDFSEPYAYIKTALVVKGDNEEIKSFEDLNGKSTANSIASTYMTLAESYGASAEGVSTLNETMELVISGRVDATLNAEVSVYDYLSVHPDADIKIAALTDEASLVEIPMTKGETELKEAVDKAIADLRSEGVLSELSIKYFGVDISGE